MRLFKEHKITTLGLGIYYLWWVLFFYVMSIPWCNLGIPLMFMLSLLIVGICLVLVVIKLFITRGQPREDYFIFLWLVTLPVVVVLVFFLAFK